MDCRPRIRLTAGHFRGILGGAPLLYDAPLVIQAPIRELDIQDCSQRDALQREVL